MLKRALHSSEGDFVTLTDTIHRTVENQIHHVRGLMERDRFKHVVDPQDGRWAWIFERVRDSISKLCYQHLWNNLMVVEEGNATGRCKDQWWHVTYGLPCPHELQQCVATNTPIMPGQIHRFWKQLTWERLDDREDPDDHVPLSTTQVNLRQLATMITSGEIDDATAYRVSNAFTDGAYPEASTIREPEPSQTRREGRRRQPNPCTTNPLPSEVRQEDFERAERGRGRRGRGRGRTAAARAERPIDDADEQPVDIVYLDFN